MRRLTKWKGRQDHARQRYPADSVTAIDLNRQGDVRVSRGHRFAAEESDHYNCRMKGGDWKTISSERHFADRNLEVVTDRVQTPARSDPRAWTISFARTSRGDRL
jgi:hypothetical protein